MSVNLTISLKHLNAVLAVLNRHIYETGDKDGVEPELVNFSGEHGDKMIIGGIGGESFIEGGFIEEGNESEVIEALERTNIGQGHKYIDILYARDFINKVETLLDNNKEMNRGEGEEEEAEEAQQEEEEEAEAEEEGEAEEDDEEVEEECSCSPPLSQCGNCIAKMREAYKNDNRPSCEKCHSKDNTSILKFGAHYHRTCDDCMDSFEGDAIAFDKYRTDTRAKRHIKYARR